MESGLGAANFLALLIFAGLAVFYFANRNSAAGREADWRRMELAHVDAMKGHDFEHYVARLMRNEGFRDVQVTPASGDFGVDIIAWRGTVKFAVQVKRCSKNVDRSAVSDAVAGIKAYRCQKAMVVTNRFLTQAAAQYAITTGCEIVDRGVLVQWIERFRGAAPGFAHPAPAPPASSGEPQDHRSPTPRVGSAGYQVGRRLASILRPAAQRAVKQPRPAPTSEQAAPQIAKQTSPAPYERTPSAASLDDMVRQVPTEVVTRIRAAQKEAFPGDLSMQLFGIEEELGDYLKLQSLCPADVPSAVMQAILQTARKCNPNSYSIQWFSVSEDIAAWRELQKLKPDGVPSDVLKQILQTAEEMNPGDFQTQLFGVSGDIEAYLAMQRLPGGHGQC